MFLLNLGHSWTHSSMTGLSGAILLPVANSAARVTRKSPGDLKTLLLDPQLYLAGLRVDKRAKACARLAGYPWFQVPGAKDFDSSAMGQKEWDKKLQALVISAWPEEPPDGDANIAKAAYDAIGWQIDCGTTAIILPAPLIEEREDEAETLGVWLDAGVEQADEHDAGLPLLATVAVSEQALNEAAFEQAGLLDAIVDQVTARSDKVDGVYIVVARTGTPTHSFETAHLVVRAYLELASRFQSCGTARIVTNFADLAGLAALGAGATSFGSGPSTSLRTLCLEAFKDVGGGISLPHLYSHGSATEYRSERDLRVIVQQRLVRVAKDETEASAPLIAAMDKGHAGERVPAWAESQNNTAAAQAHYVEVLIREGIRLRKAKPPGRGALILNWLEDAEASSLLVAKRCDGSVGRRPDTEAWREILENVLEE